MFITVDIDFRNNYHAYIYYDISLISNSIMYSYAEQVWFTAKF